MQSVEKSVESTDVIERALDAAREMLGMEMAYVADTRDGVQAYRAVTGDGESFTVHPGSSVPLEGTYCHALLEGRLDNIVRDAPSEPATRDLEITRIGGIGSYVGVPVSLSDGSVFGTFCVLSHEPNPALRERDVRLMGVLARLIADQLEQEERARREWSRAAAAGSVQALLSALEARDGYTEAHSHAVVELAVRVGRRLGVDDAELTELEWAALLHDIGKLGVADAILRKPGPLDDGEWAEMRRHPEIGERIVASIELLAHLAPTIRAEHERWDGGGYPDGLRGEEIPLASRIVLVCDAFHAMTSDRPYRVAMPVEDALEQLREHAGTQFCPRVCAAVLDLVAEERAAA